MALNDSDNADFGLLKTAKSISSLLRPTTPINGIWVNLLISSVFCMELLIKKIPKTNNNGPRTPSTEIENSHGLPPPTLLRDQDMPPEAAVRRMQPTQAAAWETTQGA